jgi:predicted dehydrogenase
VKIRYGMVGGGPGAFIGAVHRMAAALDGDYELVAGAFSSDADRSAETGGALGLEASRVHGSYERMAEAEAALPEHERIQVVSVVTPNHLHHPVAKAFLERGCHVICDKPLTTTVEDAEELCALADQHGLLFAVTYNYTGYPMVKEARARARSGALGDVRKVVVEYSQGWLRTLLEAEGQKQAEWRGDPTRAGVSSALGDIGSHAHDLVRYVTGLEIVRLFADLGTVVEGRRMEDDATVLLELEGGVRGLLVASQISTGERNHLRLRVYGSEVGLDWCQEQPNRLRLLAPDGTETILHRGGRSLSDAAAGATRLPGGHPEGFLEAFANVYREVARAIRDRVRTRADLAPAPGDGHEDESAGPSASRAYDFPTVRDGARGVRFIHDAIESQRVGGWVDARYDPPGGGA